MTAPINWDAYAALPDWTPQLGAWLSQQTPERQQTLLAGMDDVEMEPEKRCMWLDKIMFDEAVVEAQISTADAPAEFREASDRGDEDAMAAFLARRIANQLAGREWI